MKTNITPQNEIAHFQTSLQKLVWVKNAARLSIGFVWIWEGLMPKILFPSQTQFEMVERSGWWWGSPQATLHWLGVAMILAGLAIMSGIWEKAAALISTLTVLILMVLVISTNPAALRDPFGGLAKDACLFVCAALVWWWPGRLPELVRD